MCVELTNTDFSKLTDLQRRFAQEYTVDWNATRAYKAAGYKVKSDATAASSGSRLLRNDKVKAYLDHLRENLAEAAGISALWIAQHYKAQVETGVEDVFTDWFSREEYEALPRRVKACIKKLETKQERYADDNGKAIVSDWVKVEFYDKQTALKALRDMLGTDAAKKHEVGAPGGGPIELVIRTVAGPPMATSEDGIDENIQP